jgi:hypothetical protein
MVRLILRNDNTTVENPSFLVLLKGTASEPALSEAEWVP